SSIRIAASRTGVACRTTRATANPERSVWRQAIRLPTSQRPNAVMARTLEFARANVGVAGVERSEPPAGMRGEPPTLSLSKPRDDCPGRIAPAGISSEVRVWNAESVIGRALAEPVAPAGIATTETPAL